MDPGRMAARRQIALQRVTSSVTALAGLLGLAPELVEAFQSATHRDPRIAEVWRLEAMAKLLETMAQQPTGQGLDRQAIVEQLIMEVPDLTKTSTKALQAWAEAGPEAPEEA